MAWVVFLLLHFKKITLQTHSKLSVEPRPSLTLQMRGMRLRRVGRDAAVRCVFAEATVLEADNTVCRGMNVIYPLAVPKGRRLC